MVELSEVNLLANVHQLRTFRRYVAKWNNRAALLCTIFIKKMISKYYQRPWSNLYMCIILGWWPSPSLSLFQMWRNTFSESKTYQRKHLENIRSSSKYFSIGILMYTKGKKDTRAVSSIVAYIFVMNAILAIWLHSGSAHVSPLWPEVDSGSVRLSD